jgi:hypothetical protein
LLALAVVAWEKERKVAAEIVVRTRRIVVRLSSSWPHLDWYRRVCEPLRDPLPTPVSNPSG